MCVCGQVVMVCMTAAVCFALLVSIVTPVAHSQGEN